MSAFDSLNYNHILQSLMTSLNPPTQAQLNNPMQSLLAANQANSQRGKSILRLLSEQGDAQLRDNQVEFQNQLGRNHQSLIDRGLANTTVGDQFNQDAQNQLAQNDARVREGVATNLANMANNFNTIQPQQGLAQMQPSKPSVIGRIISPPVNDFGSFRPFAQGGV